MTEPERRFAPTTVRQPRNTVRQELEQVSDRIGMRTGGDRREDIFHNEVDRHDFLKTLAEAGGKADFQVHAYCLMPHHFHLVIETPNGNLVAGMQWRLSSDTLRLNHRRKRTGHVFSGQERMNPLAHLATRPRKGTPNRPQCGNTLV